MTTYNVTIRNPGQTLFKGTAIVDDSTFDIIIANYQNVTTNVLDKKYDNKYNNNTETFTNFGMDLTSITVDPITLQGYSNLGPLVATNILINGDPNNNTVSITYVDQNGNKQTFNNLNTMIDVTYFNTNSPPLSTSFNKTIVYDLLLPVGLWQLGKYIVNKWNK